MHFNEEKKNRIVYVIFVTHEMSDRKKNGLQTKRTQKNTNKKRKKKTPTKNSIECEHFVR